jgi:hypothetical protein
MDFDLFKWFVGLVLTVGIPLVSFIVRDFKTEIKNLWKKHDDMKERMQDKHDGLETRFEAHRLYTAETFPTKVDVEKGFDRVISKLNSIDEKLDRKVDKDR